MNSLVILVGLFVLFGMGLAVIAFLAYRRTLRHAKGIERGLKMVPLLIHLPPSSDDTESGSRPMQEVMREKVNQAQVVYDLIAGTAQGGFKSTFYGQRHISFEIVASNGLVHYFAAVPIALVEVVEQAIVTAYPGARLEEVEDHNIFNPQGRLTATVGGELVLKHEAAYPIGVIENMERDPMEALINSLYKLQLGDGAAVQIMLRPARSNWVKRSIKLVAKKRHNGSGGGMGFGVADIAKAAVKAPEARREETGKEEPSKLEEQMLQAIEDKTKHPGYEVLVRVLASSPTYSRSEIVLRNLVNAFALFEAPGSNGFQFIPARDIQGLVTAFIFRFFPPELVSTVLNSVELAALFHLPDAQFTATTQVERQQSKQVDGPINMPPSGLLLGYNFYRGVKKEIRLSPEDRRRHAYIVGQTGTGKSTMLENLAVQDMLAGNGFAFIDPHGDAAEKLLSMVPKERAEDVIYFNPGDMDHPLGLNIFEYSTPEQKDFLIQESLGMLYKLYDPGKTGIIGPRFEHWYRNAALTLMADPNGASFIELPKVFTDATYLKNKFKYLTDPTVIDFWTKEMGQTSDYHKSEMLGWFVSKFGAFQTNEMMRNIIGQTHSSFNLRDIMDNKKMLIVNLSKGRVGELNSQLLGMIFVIKIQAAAMSRANIPEDQRSDFSLYVDEFQNFSTDSFAAILSEARKYRLNLIVANQFIGQLTDEIRDAVFGNIGTIMSYRTGPEDAEFLVKQFEPVFDERDLVNLPNHNAVMKLLIGGLPSQPFSMTALPPLGVTHPELGVAIQQLSAAKFGTTRSVVEADIFARLQNQPAAPVMPATPPMTPVPVAAPAAAVAAPPVTPMAPPPVPQAAPPVASPLPAPPVSPPPVVAAAPPVAAPPAPTVNHSALLPTAAAPVPSVTPPSPVSAPPATGAVASAPPPPPPVSPSPPTPPAPKPPTGGIADIVKGTPPPPRKPSPIVTPSASPSRPIALPAPPPVVEIEAQEADGYTGDMSIPSSKPVNPLPAPQPIVLITPPVPKPVPSPPPAPAPIAPSIAQPVPQAPPAAPTPTLPSPLTPPIPKPEPKPIPLPSAPPPPPVAPPVAVAHPSVAPAVAQVPQPPKPSIPKPPPLKPVVQPPVVPVSSPPPPKPQPTVPPVVQPKPAPLPESMPKPVAAVPEITPIAQPKPMPKTPAPPVTPPNPVTPPKAAIAPKPPVSAPPIQSKPAPQPPKPSAPIRPPAPQPKPAPSAPVLPVEPPVAAPPPTPAASSDEPVLPPDPMASAHIELHQHGRASEDPSSAVAQQALAGQDDAPAPPPQHAKPITPPSPPKEPMSAATVNAAYVEVAAPKSVPAPTADTHSPSLENTIPDAPLPHPGEVIAPHVASVTPTPKPAPQITPQPPRTAPKGAPESKPVPKPPQSHKAAEPSRKPQPKPSHKPSPQPSHFQPPKPKQPASIQPHPQPKPEAKPTPPPVVAPAHVSTPKPPELSKSAPDPAPTLIMPTPSAPPPAEKTTVPKLQPGEVYIDENGEVVQG